MGGSKSPHDRFTCPNTGMTWHTTVIELMQEMRHTVSPRLQALLQADIDDFLRMR